MPAMWRREAPTPRACGSRGPWVSDPRRLKCCLKFCAGFWARGILVSVDQPVSDGGVRVDAAVTQEWPVAANIFQRFQVNIADENFLAVVRRFREHAAEGIAEK